MRSLLQYLWPKKSQDIVIPETSSEDSKSDSSDRDVDNPELYYFFTLSIEKETEAKTALANKGWLYIRPYLNTEEGGKYWWLVKAPDNSTLETLNTDIKEFTAAWLIKGFRDTVLTICNKNESQPDTKSTREKENSNDLTRETYMVPYYFWLLPKDAFIAQRDMTNKGWTFWRERKQDNGMILWVVRAPNWAAEEIISKDLKTFKETWLVDEMRDSVSKTCTK